MSVLSVPNSSDQSEPLQLVMEVLRRFGPRMSFGRILLLRTLPCLSYLAVSVLLLSYGCLMTVLWLSYDCLMGGGDPCRW